jgi:hypothetical protein
MQQAGTGRKLLRGAAAFTAVSGFLVDWNRTHLFNPNWPPHARFHNAQTILLGLFAGAAALYLLRDEKEDDEMRLKLGAAWPASFWLAQGGSFLFPGTGGMDSEFEHLVPSVGPVKLNEAVSSPLMLFLFGLGYLLERRHLKRHQ